MNRRLYKRIRNRGAFAPAPDTEAVARYTAETVALSIGKLTRTGYGGVALGAEDFGLVTNASAPAVTSYTIGMATQGTDAHWTRNISGISPVPSAAGDTADLSDALYVFPVTTLFADLREEISYIQITPKADTYTMASRDNFATFYTLVGAAGINNKRVELQSGSNFAAALTLSSWQPATTATVAPSNINTRPELIRLSMSGCTNLIIEDIAFRSEPLAGTNARCLIQSSSNNITVRRPYCRGNADSIYNLSVGASFVYDFIRIIGGSHIVEDADVQVVNNFIITDTNTLHSVTSRRNKVRYFYSNGIYWGSIASVGTGTLISRDDVFVASRRINLSCDHCDGVQFADTSGGDNFEIARLCVLQADGSSSCQPIWNGRSGAGLGTTPHSGTIRNLLGISRYANSVGLGCSNNNVVEYITLMKSNTGTSDSSCVSQPGIDDNSSEGPYLRLEGLPAEHIGASVARKSAVQDFTLEESPPYPSWTIASSFRIFGGGTVSSPPTNVGFAISNPQATVDAQNANFVNMTVDQIVDLYKTAYSPAAGGVLEDTDGTYFGALNPDGSWATDTPYVP